jgi:hypothetical protein
MRCDLCEEKNLIFEWKREFSLVANGWFGWHEYWKCQDCDGGHFNIVTSSYLGSIDEKVRGNRNGECING